LRQKYLKLIFLKDYNLNKLKLYLDLFKLFDRQKIEINFIFFDIIILNQSKYNILLKQLLELLGMVS
jgi:hypothetical protein